MFSKDGGVVTGCDWAKNRLKSVCLSPSIIHFFNTPLLRLSPFLHTCDHHSSLSLPFRGELAHRKHPVCIQATAKAKQISLLVWKFQMYHSSWTSCMGIYCTSLLDIVHWSGLKNVRNKTRGLGDINNKNIDCDKFLNKKNKKLQHTNTHSHQIYEAVF